MRFSPKIDPWYQQGTPEPLPHSRPSTGQIESQRVVTEQIITAVLSSFEAATFYER